MDSSSDNFNFALEWVFQYEGGFSNHPNDRGGATNFGITEKTLSAFRKRTVTVEEVRELSKEEAKVIYHDWYWSDIGLDQVSNKALATCIFDSAILVGPRTAVNFAQTAAHDCGQKLVVDGYLGPLTAQALGEVDTHKFLSDYRNLLKSRFDWIVAKDSSQLVFYTGWRNRADRLLTLKNA